jgi:phosphopantetheinyl transferase
MRRDLSATDGWLAAVPVAGLSGEVAVAAFSDRGSLGDDELLPQVSEDERRFAATLANGAVRRQFLLRRGFQRRFVAGMIDWRDEPSAIPMRREPDRRPLCLVAPLLWLSFSSSGDIAIAAASRQEQVGIDIEKLRPVSHMLELAGRFLQPNEADYLSGLPEARRADAFMRLWTIKEASLKAVGHGLGYGLDKFAIVPDGERYLLDPPQEFGSRSDWRIVPLAMPDGYVATLACYGSPKKLVNCLWKTR